MGTRNLVIVKYNKKEVIAQYGQYDGYPEYSAKYLLEFMLEGGKMQALKNNLDSGKVKLWKKLEDAEKTFGKEFSANWPSTMNSTAGCHILDLVAFARDTVHLMDSTSFARDSLFCEWAYVVDLDEDTLEVYKGMNEEDVKPGERFYRYNRFHKKDKYKPVRLFAVIRNVSSHEDRDKFVEDTVSHLSNLCIINSFVNSLAKE